MYFTGTEHSALHHAFSEAPADRNYYEAIKADGPCYAYFDIDIDTRKRHPEFYNFLSSATTTQFSQRCSTMWSSLDRKGFSRETQSYLRRKLVTFFTRKLREVTGTDVSVHMLDSSNARKFSLHVHTDLVLESNVVEGSCLAGELNRLMLLETWKTMKAIVQNEEEVDDEAITLMLLLPKCLPLDTKSASMQGFLDCAVYSRNQMFRMYANCKMGSLRFLREVDLRTGEPIPLPASGVHLRAKARQFLIQPATGFEETTERVKVDPFSCAYSTANAARAYKTRSLSNRNNQLSMTTQEEWCNMCSSAGVSCLMKTDPEPRLQERSSSVRNALPHMERSTYEVLYSNRVVYPEGDRAVGIPADTLEKGQAVHCVHCDITEDGRPDQNPSAAGIQTDDLDTGYYCFSCKKLFLVPHMVDYEGFKEDADAVVRLGPEERYFDHREVENVFEEEGTKVIAVNARMGTGNTEAAKRMLHGVGKVLIITYRIALASQLSRRFGADLYSRFLGRIDAEECGRVVVCVDSLMRVSSTGYEYVVLDEAGFLRRHFMGRTMRDRNVPVHGRLGEILNYAKKVILLQDGLTDSDIEFYLAMMRDEGKTAKIFVEKASHLRNARVSGSMSHCLGVLHKTVKQRRKTFVPVAMKRCAFAPYEFIVSYCRPEEYGDDVESWRRRVALVVGEPSLCRGVTNAVHFVSRYADFDVVVATSVLETGVSLEGHFTDVVGFFMRIPLQHRSQVQLVNRARSPENVVLFAEQGLGKRYRGDKKLLARLYATEVAVRAEFVSTFIDIQSECADVLNSNLELWVENWCSQRSSSGVSSKELYKLFIKLHNEHQEGVKKYLLQDHLSSDTVTEDYRASLIREDGILRKQGLLRVITEPAFRTAQRLECKMHHLKRQYWSSVMYFWSEMHHRASPAAQNDSKWTDILASSAGAGHTRPFDTAAMVQVGERMVKALFKRGGVPPDGSIFQLTDTSYPQLLRDLKAVQSWIGVARYTHHLGTLGDRVRSIEHAYNNGKSINNILTGLLRRSTPFDYKCGNRICVTLQGVRQRTRPIILAWPLARLGVLFAGAIRPRPWGEPMLSAREAMLREDMEAFLNAVREWFAGFVALGVPY